MSSPNNITGAVVAAQSKALHAAMLHVSPALTGLDSLLQDATAAGRAPRARRASVTVDRAAEFLDAALQASLTLQGVPEAARPADTVATIAEAIHDNLCSLALTVGALGVQVDGLDADEYQEAACDLFEQLNELTLAAVAIASRHLTDATVLAEGGAA